MQVRQSNGQFAPAPNAVKDRALELLLTHTDREAGDILGLTRAKVSDWRREAGLPSVHLARQKEKREKVMEIAGTLTDHEVAALSGASVGSVCMWRREAGIPSVQDRVKDGELGSWSAYRKMSLIDVEVRENQEKLQAWKRPECSG